MIILASGVSQLLFCSVFYQIQSITIVYIEKSKIEKERSSKKYPDSKLYVTSGVSEYVNVQGRK